MAKEPVKSASFGRGFLWHGLSVVSIAAVILTGCATYYEKNLRFQETFARGEFSEAAQLLEKEKKKKNSPTRILYYMQRGQIAHLEGHYNLSNAYLNQADLMAEDFRKNWGLEALALVSNPMVVPYRPEDFEILMINYYKALNFFQLGEYESALVECRRINLALHALKDKRKEHHRYREDAWAHNLMGIIYDALRDYNNAFIAYRNAWQAYQSTAGPEFGLKAPIQLEKDLIRAASLSGLREEQAHFEKLFGRKFEPVPAGTGEAIFLWHNGLAPVKAEWSINFTILPGEVGWVTFVNEEFGWSFPFYVGEKPEDSQRLTDLRIIRVAFPKFMERRPLFSEAVLVADGKENHLETGQDIQAIAIATLRDRMMREVGSSLLRLATKQASIVAARKGNETAGFLLEMAHAISEKADTRNWQTLPSTISYTRVNLPQNDYRFLLKAKSRDGRNSQEVEIPAVIRQGRTTLIPWHSLQSYPPGSP